MNIVDSLIARPGQTQDARLPPALAPHFVDVDERSAADLYRYARALAAQVIFYEPGATAPQPAGDWTSFFGGTLPADRDGTTPPHLALLAAFLKLYRVPRCAMNGITARHLDFFYRRVLGFAPRAARPDRAHLLLELKKGADPVAIGPAHAFGAGKDAAGAERVYAPLDETVINAAKVETLRSVFVDPASGGTVCFAPKADSADGLGAPLRGDEPRWSGFGSPDLPAAPIGFAIAAPVLRMAQGTRKVTLALEVDGLGPAVTEAGLEQGLECFVTGAKGWLGPYVLDATLAPGALGLAFTVPPEDDAVADYDVAKHGHAFAAAAPVVQVLIKVEDDRNRPHGYRDLMPAVIHRASAAVDVAGVTSLQLESDLGPLDPKRAFMPFGPTPVPGSRFMVGCPEALAKSLSELTLRLSWLGLPSPFDDIYRDYTDRPTESSLTVSAALRDAAGHTIPASRHFALLQPRDGATVTLALIGAGASVVSGPPFRFEALPSLRLRVFELGGSAMFSLAAQRERLRYPVYGFGATPAPEALAGFVAFSLDRDFGHTEYRSKLLARAPLAHEPYTPTLAGVSLAYKAASAAVPVDSASDADFANAELLFFHVGCFGQRREHGWLRKQLDLAEKRVPLFPEYPDEGELLIGLSSLAAGDSVSLLFKVAEGSADPDVDPQPEVSWAVLGNNYWKALTGGDSVRDGTDDLLATGIVNVTVPAEATVQNTFLPSGLLWLKASVQRDTTGVCALVGVAANAIAVERTSPTLAAPPASRLWTPLPKGPIAKLKTPVAAVKSVTQPFATFGGTALESDRALDTRAAERLRHRARAIDAWDCERIVLQAFPEIRKVKAVPHCAARGGFLDPGHVTLVVVPDLRLRNAVDPLQPRADADTLRRVRELVEARAPMGIGVHVRNPRFQRIRLDFKVRFRPGVEFNYHARLLREALIDHLCPWLHDPGAAIAFGGTVYKSQLLDFVEDTDTVDYVTDFRMQDMRGGPSDTQDVEEARAQTPDTILVSDASHDIAPVPDGA